VAAVGSATREGRAAQAKVHTGTEGSPLKGMVRAWGQIAVILLAALPASDPSPTLRVAVPCMLARNSRVAAVFFGAPANEIAPQQLLLGMRGGGQSAHKKKRKDDKKAALREEYDVAERWRTPEQIAAKKAAAAATVARAERRAMGGTTEGQKLAQDADKSSTGAGTESAGGSAGEQTTHGSLQGVDEGDPMERDDELATPGHDVVFLDSDELCVGDDGQEISEVDPGGALTTANLGEPGDGHMAEDDEETALRDEKDDSNFCLTHPEPVYAVAVSPFVEVRCVGFAYGWCGHMDAYAACPPSCPHIIQPICASWV